MMEVSRQVFENAIRAKIGNSTTVTRTQVKEVAKELGVTKLPAWLCNTRKRRVSRGVYSMVPLDMPTRVKIVPVSNQKDESESVMDMSVGLEVAEVSMTPKKVKGYVPFGHFNDIKKIVESKYFYPVYITGLSGNGKTMMVEQVCATLGRDCVRVNITRETDEDDLIGGFRLINGETVWQDGPVITAMKRGAVLLLDEVDLGDAKLMCLQPVLEGKPVFIKKIVRKVEPAPGFNIIATANTKGKGSDDGRFIGTNVMNEAFLERFSITFEQEYPSSKIEAKIVENVLEDLGVSDVDFVKRLVSWAEIIRKTYMEGAISELISTRRLVHIAQAYCIFGTDRMKAINLCISRFDDDTRRAMVELYKKVDETASKIDPKVAKKMSRSFQTY